MDYELLKDYLLCRGIPLSAEKKQDLLKTAVERNDPKYLGMLYTFGGIVPDKKLLLDCLDDERRDVFFKILSILPDREILDYFSRETKNTLLHYISATRISTSFFCEIMDILFKKTNGNLDYFREKNFLNMDFIMLLLQYRQYQWISCYLPELSRLFSEKCFQFLVHCNNPLFMESLLKHGLYVDPILYTKCDDRIRQICFYYLKKRDYKDVKDKKELKYIYCHGLLSIF